MEKADSSAHIDSLWAALRGPERESARRRLVEHYVGLVKFVASRLAVGLPHYVEFTDLCSAGLLGLIQAIDHFDVSRGYKFETYAVPRIRGAILDELRAQDWFPRSLRRKARRLEKAYATLESRLGRAATDNEVSRELGVPLAEFHRLVAQVSVATIVSLDADTQQDERGSLARLSETVPDTQGEHPEQALADRELREVLSQTLAELPEKEQLVLTLYYYEELSLKEIGAILEVTESRVCQIHTKAIFRLRGKVSRKLSEKPIWRLGKEVAGSRALERSPGEGVVSSGARVVIGAAICAGLWACRIGGQVLS
jgi:RNA polymerase sigma factor for flagellar operon FliA